MLSRAKICILYLKYYFLIIYLKIIFESTDEKFKNTKLKLKPDEEVVEIRLIGVKSFSHELVIFDRQNNFSDFMHPRFLKTLTR